MSSRERERLKVFERVKQGELTLREAAAIGGLSYRQTRRMYKRYYDDGDRGLVHQGRWATVEPRSPGGVQNDRVSPLSRKIP